MQTIIATKDEEIAKYRTTEVRVSLHACVASAVKHPQTFAICSVQQRVTQLERILLDKLNEEKENEIHVQAQRLSVNSGGSHIFSPAYLHRPLSPFNFGARPRLSEQRLPSSRRYEACAVPAQARRSPLKEMRAVSRTESEDGSPSQRSPLMIAKVPTKTTIDVVLPVEAKKVHAPAEPVPTPSLPSTAEQVYAEAPRVLAPTHVPHNVTELPSSDLQLEWVHGMLSSASDAARALPRHTTPRDSRTTRTARTAHRT